LRQKNQEEGAYVPSQFGQEIIRSEKNYRTSIASIPRLSQPSKSRRRNGFRTVVAKTVVVKADNQFVMLYCPLRRNGFSRSARNPQSEAAKASERGGVRRLVPDSEVGAMPPFGNLYGLPVYADESLAGDRAILFNAEHIRTDSHELSDFARLAEPQICSLAARRGTRSS